VIKLYYYYYLLIFFQIVGEKILSYREIIKFVFVVAPDGIV
jgi:hypothetical protein